MPSTLTWIDHDEKARERTLRILALFQEKESRDELGLGSVRDSFADQLFPGTSTIQTRLRYMLFVPWIYQRLENKKVSVDRFAAQADKLERDLIQPLLDSGERRGVFGRVAGKRLKRLPSSVYWAGLGAWGIRLTPYSQEEYHKRIDALYRRREALKSSKKAAKERGDDYDIDPEVSTLSWHQRLPTTPETFPAKVDFALSQDEAAFIRDRIQQNWEGSLLSFLSLHCPPADIQAPWEHPDYGRFSKEHKELLKHARLFSETMHGAALLYNIMLAEEKRADRYVSEHRESFQVWAKEFPLDEVRVWEIGRLYQLTMNYDHKITSHTITKKTRNFVEAWISFCKNCDGGRLDRLIHNSEARKLIEEREVKLKGSWSRFKNRRALEQWGGYSGIGKLVYRWPNVKVLLNDLYQGLQRER